MAGHSSKLTGVLLEASKAVLPDKTVSAVFLSRNLVGTRKISGGSLLATLASRSGIDLFQETKNSNFSSWKTVLLRDSVLVALFGTPCILVKYIIANASDQQWDLKFIPSSRWKCLVLCRLIRLPLERQLIVT